MSIERLIIKIRLNIKNDNQDKVIKYFREYNDYLELTNDYPTKEEHNEICLEYINYQVKKSQN